MDSTEVGVNNNPVDGVSWVKEAKRMLQVAPKNNEAVQINVVNGNKVDNPQEVSINVVNENNMENLQEVSVKNKKKKKGKRKNDVNVIDEQVPKDGNNEIKENDTETKVHSHTNDSSLDLLGEVVNRLKSDDKIFVDVLRKLLGTNVNTKYSKLRSHLIQTVTQNLIDTSNDELEKLKKELNDVFLLTRLKKFVVNDEDIQLVFPLKRLGMGASSEVFLGSLSKNGIKRNVAIKTLQTFEYRRLFRDEVNILSQLEHQNIIKLLAINRDVTDIALEYMDYGNISNAVYKNLIPEDTKTALKIILDVANGMEYMHSQKFLHRDLACRNVLINSKLECKIGDFGSTVYVGDNSKGEYFDEGLARADEEEDIVFSENTSPETARIHKFTYKSDSWSMGIFCWCLFQMVSSLTEYKILILFRHEFFRNVRNGWIKLDKRPHLCPINLFSYINDKLLALDPSQRPNFGEIKRTIENLQN